MVKPWMGVTPPPRGQGYYANEEGLDLPYGPGAYNREAIKRVVEAGLAKWFETATPEQIRELVFEPYQAFKKESK